MQKPKTRQRIVSHTSLAYVLGRSCFQVGSLPCLNWFSCISDHGVDEFHLKIGFNKLWTRVENQNFRATRATLRSMLPQHHSPSSLESLPFHAGTLPVQEFSIKASSRREHPYEQAEVPSSYHIIHVLGMSHGRSHRWVYSRPSLSYTSISGVWHRTALVLNSPPAFGWHSNWYLLLVEHLRFSRAGVSTASFSVGYSCELSWLVWSFCNSPCQRTVMNQ